MPDTPRPRPKAGPRRRRPRAPSPALRQWAAEVGAKLAEIHPDARCALDFSDPFQLLVSVILSAQCTDKLVNQTTPGLFARFSDAASLAAADPAEVEGLIRRIGLYRNKAKAIRAAAREIVERHGGRLPDTMEGLTALPGVGRKTANVVLAEAFGIAVGVVTDTHVLRVSRRIGLTRNTAPEKVEADLAALFPQSDWILLAHRLIFHGRRICKARKPECWRCGLAPLCKYRPKTPPPEE